MEQTRREVVHFRLRYRPKGKKKGVIVEYTTNYKYPNGYNSYYPNEVTMQEIEFIRFLAGELLNKDNYRVKQWPLGEVVYNKLGER